ncbi:carboxypeptidase regulatory-like domain-containing protein [Glycomyces sp. TRM65418]|uniref:carboxypeptidase-like regulatory domain-containing protein n=1 Tax=Glycomyces sp. TRM65418 TaxID=2867006 RepID=UPI001CE70169|nr:carboxypeptidase-like regulatory domain-containing protein [Glycomyces sp. TRM65418]MCC3764090.1 carboxypeptidase regulatory-like domain-containing protein [Glycomyces sp. TRM65418]QZD53779.1 carboxypeptidase regulatory-like domain-containing protein [Glycomyces sp. TRM65418]
MTGAAEPSGTQTNVPRSRRGRRGALRARLAGLAAAAGVLIGILAFPQAAFAQEVGGWFNGSFNPNPVSIGGQATVISFTVQNNSPVQPKDITIKAKVDGLNDYISAVDNDAGGGLCTREDGGKAKCTQVEPGGQRTVSFTVVTATESELPDGEQVSGNFTVEFEGQSQSSGLNVVGVATVATVSTISGTVTSNAEPVSGAKVELTDGEGNKHEATTGDDGSYSINGDASNPIAPGDMTMVITAEGFEDKEETFAVAEGSGSFTRNVTLAQVQTEETTSAAPTTAAAPTEASADPEPPEDEGMSGTLIFLIIIGALLVIGGIVGIVFLLRGGKDDKDDDDAESFAPDGPPEHQPTAAQVGTPGVYQAAPGPEADAPTMIHPGGLVDGAGNPSAATQFGPAYGGADATQVMPQSGFGAGPGGPSLGPDGTTILPVVKQPGGPGASDATQIMPQANLGSKPPAAAPPSPYGDPAATRPHPGPTAAPTPYSDPTAAPTPYSDPNATRPHPGASPSPNPSPYGDLGSTRPHPAPTPPPATGSMFEPQQPGGAPGSQPDQGYRPQGAPSAPQYGPGSPSFGAQESAPGPRGYGSQEAAPGSQAYGAQAPGSGPQGYGGQEPGGQGYGSHAPPGGQPPASAPRSAPPSGDPYPSQSMRRDPYAPPEQPPPPAGDYGATRAMPQYGDQSQPPAAPYGGESNREDEDPDSKRTDRRSWGEWDDRPRSW